MGKINRNGPCPCGSGKKFKKCCLEKLRQTNISEAFSRHWTYDKVNEMSTIEIIKRLESIGIIFDKDVFLGDIKKIYSAEQISENWFKNFRVTAKGLDEDIPWLAAWILWERLAPKDILSMEQMSDLIDKGFEYLSKNDFKTACDIWLKVWEAMKYRFKPEHKNLEFLDRQYSGSFLIRNFCQNVENELFNAGLKDKTYFKKRIIYCREFLDYFPEEDELIIHNMRLNIAESYSNLDNYEQAELEYKKIVQDYPDNPWGYISWGDMYFLDKKKDYSKAKEYYEKALGMAKDKTDKTASQERLEDLEYEMRIL